MNEQWDRYLDNIMTDAQDLRNYEPTEEELNIAKEIEDRLGTMLDYIRDGRPETLADFQ